MAELEGGELAALLADEGAKRQRREIEKKMNVHVQQISSTLDQVWEEVFRHALTGESLCMSIIDGRAGMNK